MIATRETNAQILTDDVLEYLRKKTPGIFDSSQFRIWRQSTCRHGFLFHECPKKPADAVKCPVERPVIFDDTNALLREAVERLVNAGFFYKTSLIDLDTHRFTVRVKPPSPVPLTATIQVLDKIAAMEPKVSARPPVSDSEHLTIVKLREEKKLSFEQISKFMGTEFGLPRATSTLRSVYRKHLAQNGSCPACERAKLLLAK